MLDYIRSSAQSFGVKIAFAIIILVFVFWGIGNFNDRDYTNIVAVVNGQPIVAMEFEKAYRNAEEQIMRANPGITRQDLEKRHLGRSVLQELIQETLLAQEAARAGVSVSPIELRRAVGGIKAFQNDKGQFDPDAYKRALAAQRMSPAQYEQLLANDLLREKMFSLVAGSVWTDPADARNMFDFMRERRKASYIFLPASSYVGKASIKPEEARAWYDAHLREFAIPPRVDVAYIAVKPENLVDPSTIKEANARAWYEKNKSEFENAEAVHVAHILVPVAENAAGGELKKAEETMAKIQAELAAGKPFASVADEFNGERAGGPGGDLGWISRGEAVAPFEEAAFALDPGKISEVVRTPFGMHLIQVKEKREAGVKPFEEVSSQIVVKIAAEEGADKIQEALDNLIEDNILQKPLAESAARYGLKVEQTGLLDAPSLSEKLGVNAEGANALLALGKDIPLDSALEAGDKYIVARVVASEAAGTKPFAEVEKDITDQLMAAKALDLAMDAGAKELEKIRKDKPDAAALAKMGLQTTDVLERSGAISGFTPDASFMEALFEGVPGQWLSRPYAESNDDNGKGALIARVDEVLPPEPEEFAGVESILNTASKNQRQEAIFELFMRSLADEAKVEITNQNLIDRVNM